MEIVFLLAGLALIAVGVLIIVFEVRDRQGTTPVQARVVGFSTGRSSNAKVSSFHSVAEYVGNDGRKYYVEGTVGSSVPLHAVDDTVMVLVSSEDPAKAVLRSRLSFVLGSVLALMGLVSVVIFRLTFRPGLLSIVTAAFVIGGLVLKIRTKWRKQPLSVEAWQEYKNKVLSTRVFTDDTRDQIAWADPGRIAAAVESYRKTNRFAVPLLLLLGVGLLSLSYHFYTRTETFLRVADRTSGQVVDLRETDSSDGETTYAAVVEYTDGRGEKFKFVDSFSSRPPTYDTGQVVNVIYDPIDPNNARIDRGYLNYLAPFLLGFLGALFLLGGLHSARKKFA